MIEYQHMQIRTVIKYLIMTIVNKYFRKLMKQLMLITNANIKSEIREIKAKKEKESLNKNIFLILY